jgi:SsrA-binding protein
MPTNATPGGHPKKPSSGGGIKRVASNPTARANYFIEDTLEAGLVLSGTEVKSIRQQTPNLRDAFVEVRGARGLPTGKDAEAWLLNAHIAPYAYGNIWNHEPLRKRKLLLHRQEIHRLQVAITQKGLSVIPLQLYFKSGRLKLEIGLGKGKKKVDKRETLKRRSAEREIEQAQKVRSRGRSSYED